MTRDGPSAEIRGAAFYQTRTPSPTGLEQSTVYTRLEAFVVEVRAIVHHSFDPVQKKGFHLDFQAFFILAIK